MPTITTKDGTEIYYKDWGSGQPIVFSHGWPLSADDWDAQMLFFLGHGPTSAGGPASGTVTRDLRLHLRAVAVRADAVAERGRRALPDVLLDRYPPALLVAAGLAVGTDGQEPAEMRELLLQVQHPLGDP